MAVVVRTSDLVGKWDAATDDESCSIFLTMIKSGDGMRATSHGCDSERLKSVWSWSQDGTGIVLGDESGGMIGVFQMTKANEGQGQLADGATISLRRNGDEAAPMSRGNRSDSAAGPGKAEVQQTDLRGSWRIKSSKERCELFLTMTTGPKGYEASTRDCEELELQAISSWQLKNQKIVLLSDSGRSLARLSSSGDDQFTGRLVGGTRIAMTR